MTLRQFLRVVKIDEGDLVVIWDLKDDEMYYFHIRFNTIPDSLFEQFQNRIVSRAYVSHSDEHMIYLKP